MPSAILEKLWERTTNRTKPSDQANNNWNQEMEALYELGIGMEETLRYLYGTQPSLQQFTEWIRAQRQDLKEVDTTGMENVLSPADLDFWEENGYLVLKNAIPKEDCEAAQNAIWEFLGMRATDPSSWYKSHSELRGLMLTFTNHPCLHKNRQSPRIKKAYEQLYQNNHLYKRIDKVSFNPPETHNFRFAGDNLHWDVSLKQPIAYGLQGLLYLTNCEEQDGAFKCVPGFHKSIGNWLAQLPQGTNPRGLAPQVLTPVAVTGNAGDFVIWHQALPHCASPNHGSYPRMVQYLTYLPIGYEEEKVWI